MKRKMEELKKEGEPLFEMESPDKSVKIVMNGSRSIKEVKIQGICPG